MRKIILPITTDASGDATVNAPEVLIGKLFAVEVDLGTLTSGAVDLTFTVQGGTVAQTLLTLTNLAASAIYYPRHVVHDAAATALTGTAGGDRVMPLVAGRIRVVVAAGGNVKTGRAVLYIEG